METQKIVVTATKIIFTVVFTRCGTNRCMGIYKIGNKYLPSVYKTQFKFRSHFSGKKVCLIGQETQYLESRSRGISYMKYVNGRIQMTGR
jgi:hypothetical protein